MFGYFSLLRTTTHVQSLQLCSLRKVQAWYCPREWKMAWFTLCGKIKAVLSWIPINHWTDTSLLCFLLCQPSFIPYVAVLLVHTYIQTLNICHVWCLVQFLTWWYIFVVVVVVEAYFMCRKRPCVCPQIWDRFPIVITISWILLLEEQYP